MVQNRGSIIAGVVICLVVLFSLIAAGILSYIRSREEQKHKASDDEEGQLHTTDISEAPLKMKKRPPELPLYKTRESLSRSAQSSPVEVVTPGIRFTVTSPSHMSRKTASIASLPSIEDVLEKHEQDLDADHWVQSTKKDVLAVASVLTDGGVALGEPGTALRNEDVEVVGGPIKMLDNMKQEQYRKTEYVRSKATESAKSEGM